MASLVFEAGGAETTFARFCAYCGIYGQDTITSESGQFVVHGSTLPLPPRRTATNNPAMVELNSQLAAVSAERTRRLFARQLHLQERHRDEVHIILLNRIEPDAPIHLVTRVFSDRFQYQLGLPGRLENTRLVRSLVRSMLQEFANRGGRRSADLPPWIVEGMTQQVLSEFMPAYVSNRRPLTREVSGYDLLSDARTYFSTNSCMTIEELSFYGDSEGEALDRKRFDYSAQLLVHELLQLPNGAMLMQNFLRTLPSTLNWQTAFYHTYAAHFKDPLALTKWWMLTWVDFQSRRAQEVWPVDVSLQKLEALLQTTLETRASPDSLPEHRQTTLSDFITETPFSTHKGVLTEKVQQLFFLAHQLAPTVAGLAGEYQECLRSYVDRRSVVEYQPALRSDPQARKDQVTRNALEALKGLDNLRADLKAGKTISLPGKPRSTSRASR